MTVVPPPFPQRHHVGRLPDHCRMYLDNTHVSHRDGTRHGARISHRAGALRLSHAQQAHRNSQLKLGLKPTLFWASRDRRSKRYIHRVRAKPMTNCKDQSPRLWTTRSMTYGIETGTRAWVKAGYRHWDAVHNARPRRVDSVNDARVGFSAHGLGT